MAAAGGDAGFVNGAPIGEGFEDFRAAVGWEPEAGAGGEGGGGGGWMTVAGFGALLSERSSRMTFPALRNFRTGRLRGWRRVFAHRGGAPFRHIERVETKEMASLSCEPHAGSELVVALMDVPLEEPSWADFVVREHEYRFVAVAVDGLPRPAVLCAAWTDEDYRRVRCPDAEYHRRYGQYGIDRIWRDDLLPARLYLRHCVLSARSLSDEAHASFLDQTFLGDRTTTIREHLARNPGLMDEEPPEHLRVRYGG